ncbi:MAG: tRNA (adenosine(37)-N6)-threonylcarbamoyltransferase complex dimerization subunit type 1 TsaB [Ferruginibacter sp.]
MIYILNIDTSSPKALVFLSANGLIVQSEYNENQRDHASFLHPAIKMLLVKENIRMADLSAVAVAIGPGSYTGIRVGMATAKGLCFALNIPIIALDNLFILAASCKRRVNDSSLLICSMIDARRMEVFTATYDSNLELKIEPEAMVLNENSFISNISKCNIVFCGNGSNKFKQLLSPEIEIIDITDTTEVMAHLSFDLYSNNQYGNLKDVKPFYMKEFYNG